MPSPSDLRLERLALDSGVVSRAQLDRALSELARRENSGAAPGRLELILQEQGALSDAQLSGILRMAKSLAESQSETMVEPAATPSEVDVTALNRPPEAAVRTVATEVRANLGKYEILEELGRGGMGVVYRALDLELRREVALKMLRLGDVADGELVERLLREARTVATLDHPGIVPIHEVGTHEGDPYFAMAYIRGRTLDQVLREGGLPGFRERAEVLADAADAVAHAHEKRVIHRDLKPSNLLLDEAGRVHVLDFGLAKTLGEGTRLTAIGQMVGTPSYMSPEQIHGEWERIGAAADVYSLGAVLYEVLTGRPPFAGVNVAELLGRALMRDPVPPRKIDARIPGDLETICLKALSKEIERRYPTAREFADELRRFLRGEAISARPDSWARKGARWVRRRRALAILSAAVLLAAGSSVALGVRAAAARGEQARLEAEVLGGLRELSAAYLKATLIVRRAGARLAEAQDEFLVSLQRVVDRAVAQAPALPEPHYHLGVMYRALMRFDDALREQERALGKDPEYAPSLYERAVLLVRVASERRTALREAWREAESQRLASIGLIVQGGMGGEAARPRPTDSELTAGDETARGLVRSLSDDLARLERVVAASDGRAEHSLAPGRIECVRGLTRIFSDAPGALDEARALLERALSLAPGLDEAGEGLAALEAGVGHIDRALAALDRVLVVDRGFVPCLLARGRIHLERGAARRAASQDPEADFRVAEADLTRAVELWPGSARAVLDRGTLYSEWALWILRKGSGEEGTFHRAVADLGKAAELDPHSDRSLLIRGYLYGFRGSMEIELGRAPDPFLAPAQDDLKRALELNPRSADGWMWLGFFLTRWAQSDGQSSRDAEPRYLDSIAAHDRSLGLRADVPMAWTARAFARTACGRFRFDHGRDPADQYHAAEADYGKVLELDPHWSDAFVGRGLVRFYLGQAQEQVGLDPTPLFEHAFADLEEAIRLRPRAVRPLGVLGTLQMAWGIHLVSAGQDGCDRFRRAEEAFQAALVLLPQYSEARMKHGSALALLGQYCAPTAAEARERFREACAESERATQDGPGLAEAWYRYGAVLLTCGRKSSTWGEDPRARIADAERALSRALGIDGNHADATLHRGRARFFLGLVREAAGESPAEAYAEALADLTRARDIHPGNGDAGVLRGSTLRLLGRYGEACAEFEGVFRSHPARRTELANCVTQLTFLRDLERNGARVPPAFSALLRGLEASQIADYRSSLRILERAVLEFRDELRALPEADRRRLLEETSLRSEIFNAHHCLACYHALLSVGKEGPQEAGHPVPEAEAAELRDLAFREVEEALGYAQGFEAHVLSDKDLDPIHDDPRWAAIVRRLREK